MIKRFEGTFASSLALALLFVASSTNCWGESPPETDPDRPNIIVVMADDMGFSDLGCYGGEIKTPTIDRLASEGVRFSQFYNCALCGPSRGSLMTGCYPWQVGPRLRTNVFANLEKNCVTVMELLKANGYETCVVGRPDVVTAEDWHDPAQLAKCADRFLCTVTSKSRPGPGNYYKAVTANPWLARNKGIL